QGWRHKPRKIHDKKLLRRVAHAGRIVDDQDLWRQMLEQMRRGYIGEIERRILTQEHDVERCEIRCSCAAQGDMIAYDIADLDRRRLRHDPALAQRKLVRSVVREPMAPRACLEQEREGRIARDVDPVDWV